MSRMDKVNSEIQRLVADVISREISNVTLNNGLITVTKVETSPDFSQSKIFVSMLGIKDKKEALKILKKASGFIRSRIANRLNFRKTPNLIFIFDESIEYGTHINKLLSQVSEELKNSNSNDTDSTEE